MWNALKKAAGAAFGAGLEEVTKNATKEVMEAAVAGAALVIYADGQAEAAEVDKLKKFITTHPALKAHATNALKFFEHMQEQFELDYDSGMDQVVKELGEISSEADKKIVVRIAVALAKADAEGIEDTEVRAIEVICRTLGVSSKEFLPK